MSSLIYQGFVSLERFFENPKNLFVKLLQQSVKNKSTSKQAQRQK